VTGALPTLVGFLTLLAAVGGAWFIVKYVSAQDTSAELQAKDGAIATQAQVNDANEHRIAQLEKDVLRLAEENASLKGKVEFLEQYSAQALAERIEAQQEVMIGILQGIQREISSR
jgi:predicted RNase H-like nuclease (RuvC/YqgF family)